MIVPRYWAEARLQERRDGKQRTIRRYGWSDTSQADGQQMAEERVHDAMRRAREGEDVAKREHKVPYNGADGLPIREEVLDVQGSTVITRNSYGARCLNTPDVLIADVDFDERERPFEVALAGAVGLATTLLVLVALGRFAAWACVVGPLAWIAVLAVMRRARRARVANAGGAEQLALARVRAYCEAHPEWRAHVYRTPRGLRVIATHRRFEPTEPAVDDFFAKLDVDPMYRKMCRLQRCFRARLTAKPWRIGVTSHMKPRPGVWPVREERRAERSAWLAVYEAKAEGFAACRAMGRFGAGETDEHADAVRQLHDEASRASSELPIA